MEKDIEHLEEKFPKGDKKRGEAMKGCGKKEDNLMFCGEKYLLFGDIYLCNECYQKEEVKNNENN